MIGITKMQGRYTEHSPSNAEEFNSASRSVKPGLIATGIVSAWTWAATLLQSSAVAYKFGISGSESSFLVGFPASPRPSSTSAHPHQRPCPP